jgi:uncharacterized protein (DUF342 family)
MGCSMKKIFSAVTIEKCIEIACDELNVAKDKLNYTIVEEKKGLFRKTASISVDTGLLNEDINTQKDIDIINEADGTVCIEDGEIKVQNPKDGGSLASIILPASKIISVFVNGSEVKEKSILISEEDNIFIQFNSEKASREIKINMDSNKMEAYLSIIYTPEIRYKLIDAAKSHSIKLNFEETDRIMPPQYTFKEIEEALKTQGIVFGVFREKIVDILKTGCENLLIAKGNEKQDGTDDSIKLKFKTDKNEPKLMEDNNGNVDFKSIGLVDGVNAGDIIAEKIEGNPGLNGKDITGHIVRCRNIKKIKLKAGQGCTVKNDNVIIATISGKPCLNGSTFCVYEVHEVRKDVDISTGNIKFIGDIIICGSVKEGMEVDAGNAVTILKGVERAKIISRGNIDIKGNVIAANLLGGGQDVLKLRLIQNITNLKESLESLIMTISEIKKYNLLGEDKRDGEIIKLLIDSRFKGLPRLCLSIITDIKLDSDDEGEDKLVELIRNKLLGLAPVNIKHQSELNEVMECAVNKIDMLKCVLSLPVTVKFSYCQDSQIQSSGDVIIAGKGEYVSNITANNSILFLEERSVARGGVLRASKEIRCREVGSTACVSTRLEVDKEGQIWADVAYINTLFSIGNREFNLEKPSKNVHAYIDDKGDIIVDRLVL